MLCDRNYIAMWWLGMINNLIYCVIISAANDIATEYGSKSEVGLISWANCAMGTLIRFLNAFFLYKHSVGSRIIATTIMNVVGIMIIACSKYVGSTGTAHFWFALLGVTTTGTACSLGEAVLLGYLEKFPPTLVGGFSSGTGMSGVLGSLLYLGLRSAGWQFDTSFLLLNVFIAIYVLVFFFGLREPPPLLTIEDMASKINSEAPPAHASLLGQASSTTPTGAHRGIENEAEFVVEGDSMVGAPQDLEPNSSPAERDSYSWARIRRVHGQVFLNSLSLFLVYAFEYACQFAAPFAVPCWTVKSSNFFVKNSYVLFQFCYQFGVLFSRSSLSFFHIEKVHWLTAVQGLNAVFWLLQGKYLWIHGDLDPENGVSPDPAANSATGIWALYLLMWFVGLLGGAAYVNVFYKILNDRDIAPEDRNLAMNLAAIYVNFGIMAGSLLDVLFANTLITRACPDN